MRIPPDIQPFWDTFQESVGAIDPSRFYEACYFADSEAVANELAALVLQGTKRATASLVWGLEAANKAPPKPGDLTVITDWLGTALCVIETQSIQVTPFDEVSEAFAATEGEGDKSLAYWRKEHWAYFDRECKFIGKTPDLKMPVLCEVFSVVYIVAKNVAA